MISATVFGNIGRDAEYKVTTGGTGVCSFTLAANGRNGKEKVTTWMRCSIYGKRAEGAAPHLKKGTRIVADGRLIMREYEKDGQTKSVLEFTIDEFDFAGDPKPKDAAEPAQNASDDDFNFP